MFLLLLYYWLYFIVFLTVISWQWNWGGVILGFYEHAGRGLLINFSLSLEPGLQVYVNEGICVFVVKKDT